MSLRARLLLALAYVLLLSILALLVPLLVSVRDRVDSEVKSQARGEAEIVAAAAAEHAAPRQALVETAAQRVRGRVILVDARGRVTADSAGTGTRGEDYEQPARDRRRAARRDRRRRSASRGRSARRSSPPRCRSVSAGGRHRAPCG